MIRETEALVSDRLRIGIDSWLNKGEVWKIPRRRIRVELVHPAQIWFRRGALNVGHEDGPRQAVLVVHPPGQAAFLETT